MSEVGGDSDDNITTGGGETSGGTETGGTGDAPGGEVTESGGGTETGSISISESAGEIGTATSVGVEHSNETGFARGPETAVPSSIQEAQSYVETCHNNALAQILGSNSQYISEADMTRITNGVDETKAIMPDPNGRIGGYYSFTNGHSEIAVSALNKGQMERSTQHETNHQCSHNREVIVPDPQKHGYWRYNTVGTRQYEVFHNTRTGEEFNYSEKGRGLNEGITTMFTNQQISEISQERGEAARNSGVYPYATELCEQLEELVGKDTIKEAYYGGNLQGLENKVNEMANEKCYDQLRDCFDRAISDDPVERFTAMKEAQEILAKMDENGETKA